MDGREIYEASIKSQNDIAAEKLTSPQRQGIANLLVGCVIAIILLLIVLILFVLLTADRPIDLLSGVIRWIYSNATPTWSTYCL